MNIRLCRARAARWAAALSLLFAAPVFAQNYPTRPIKLVAPFAAGGASDVLARALAEGLRAELGQAVVVENRGGAGGTIGVGAVAQAPADGYTIVLGGIGSLVFAEGAYKLSYSILKDLRPVGMAASAQSALVVRTSLGVNTVPELLQRVKRGPALTYGSPGVGSALHLSGVMFEQITGSKLVHVPYKGLAPALSDVQAGNVDMAFANITSLTPFLQSGKMKPLVVIDDKPSPQLPGVPMSAAVGLRGLLMNTWYGLMVPAGVPDPVVKRLETALAAVVKRDTFIRTMQAQGFDVEDNPSTAHMASVIRSDYERWVPLIRKLNLQMQ